MNGEIAILGVFVPTVLVLAILAAILTQVSLRLVDLAGLYRFVAYRALVDLCIFVILFGVLSFVAPHIGFRP